MMRTAEEIEALLAQNRDAIDNVVIDFLEDVIVGQELIAKLNTLKDARNELFDELEVIEG